MKKILLTLVAISALLAACTQEKQKEAAEENPTDIFTKVYTTDNLANQSFFFQADKETVLKDKSGTTLRISKNTFVDSSGNPVKGTIHMELKEVFSPADFVLGNMTTTSDGKYLQSGGMIYTNATSDGKQLRIADGKDIGVVVPTDSTIEGMQLFEGVQDSTGINWKNPVALNKPVLPGQIPAGVQEVVNEETGSTNVSVETQGDLNRDMDYPQDVLDSVFNIAWGGKGLIITKDSVVKIGKYKIRLVKEDTVREVFWPAELDPTFTSTPVKGVNTFTEDSKTNYIFSIKKLGWANIDRLFSDPRTKEVEFVTSIKNQAEFKTIYVSLIVSNQKMYIPGYQKKDNTFSFTHGDYEKPSLPVSETATILATAYKDDKPYFAIQKIKIQDKQKISFQLTETTMGKLKAELKEKI
jgi:hypothetical protein